MFTETVICYTFILKVNNNNLKICLKYEVSEGDSQWFLKHFYVSDMLDSRKSYKKDSYFLKKQCAP